MHVSRSTVTFPSWNAFVPSQMAGGEASVCDVEAELFLPDSPHPPMSGVVLAQGLGGPLATREYRYGEMLAREGYAAIVLESFRSRGADYHIEALRALEVTETMILADSFAALRFLAARPDIDKSRVFIVGFSYGGMVSWLSACEQIAELFLPGGPRFAGHLGYYPCSVPRLDSTRTTGAPVSLLLGGKDGNVDIPRTREIAADLRSGGSPVDLVVFPDAYHQWDSATEDHDFVRFSLANCRMRLDDRGDIHDERSGLRMTGQGTRTLILAMSADPGGYHLRRCEETSRKSDDILLGRLAA